MTIKSTGGVAGTIEELEARHTQLLGELADVETAIRVLHALQAPRLPWTSAAPPNAPTARTAAAPPKPADDDNAGDGALPAKVRAALKDGPLKRLELIQKGRVSGYDIKRYVRDGLLIATGVTHGRRFALPGTSAKEAP